MIRFFLPLVSALLFTLSFAPFHPHLRFCIYLAFIPYLYAILHSKRRVFLTGFLFGFAANAGILWWISAMIVEDVSRVLIASGVALLILYLSLYWGLVAFLVSKMKNRSLAIFSLPFFWVSLEFIRSLTSQLGFPWGSVGYAFSRVPSLIQIASITGLPGISFLILFCSSLLYWSFTQQKWKRNVWGIAVFVVIFVIQVIAGNAIIARAQQEQTVKIALIQANILPEIKRVHEVDERIAALERLTLTAASRKPDLIVWSETSVPCHYREDSDCIMRIKDIVRRGGVPVVAGAPEFFVSHKKKERKRYNAAFLISRDGETLGKYRKIYLVGFGEHLPFDNTIPALKKLNLGQGDYSPGSAFTVLSQGTFTFSVLICFEAIFPRLVRKMVRNGAELLVNMTEDSWYGRTAGPYQHAEMAVIRAVENRISVARCANSGISMLIDPYGRILKSSTLFKETIVEGDIPLRRGKTFYTRFGDVFAWVIVFLALCMLLFPYLKNRFPRLK